MSTITINAHSFVAVGMNKYGYEVGTVEVNGKVQRAVRNNYSISLHGYVGRYRTSNKAWMAHVSSNANGVTAYFGRDDRSGRFNKMSGISYEPALYDTISNEKFWAVV